MMKELVYTITWFLVVPTGCPDYKQDKFGRWPLTHCAVYHTVQEKQTKEFKDRSEAISFLKDCTLEFGSGKCYLDSIIHDVKIYTK